MELIGFDLFVIVLTGSAFLVAGFIKGVIGMGLPMISITIMMPFLGLQKALAILIIPALLTNLWQAASGGYARQIWVRMKRFLLFGTIATFLTARLLAIADPAMLSRGLGMVLIGYSAIALLGGRFSTPARYEKWLAPMVGGVSGGIGGLTGIFLMPAVLFFQSIALNRRFMVQLLGIWFSLGIGSLGAGLTITGLLSRDDIVMSGFCLLPALLGMACGRQLLGKLSEELFRKLLLIALQCSGYWIIYRSL